MIREVTPADAAERREMWARSFVAGHTNEAEGVTRDELELTAAELTSPGAIVERQSRPAEPHRKMWCSVIDGRIAGTIGLEFNTNEVRTMYVDPEYFGQGVGQTLMEHGLRELDPSRDALVKVVETNTRARRFYEKFGFEMDGPAEPFKLSSGKEMPTVQLRRLAG